MAPGRKKASKDTPSTKNTRSSTASASGMHKKTTRSKRAGITFPVGRMHRYIKNAKIADRISKAAPVYTAAVLEYLVAELLELAGNAAQQNKKSRINPRHVYLAVRNDSELHELLKDVTFPSAGVVPHVHPNLLKLKADIMKERSWDGNLRKDNVESQSPGKKTATRTRDADEE